MEVVAVQGQMRAEVGKKGSKDARKREMIPCVMYGGEENIHFEAAFNEVRHLIFTPEFKLAEVSIDGKSYRSIVKDVQFHPVTEEVLHMDFQRLIEGRKIKVEVPVQLTGTPEGVKSGGVLQQLLRRVAIKTVPEKLVDVLYADVSSLEMGSSIRIKDIGLGEGVEILRQPNTPVGTVVTPRALRSATSAAELEGEEGELLEEGAEAATEEEGTGEE